MLKMKNKCERCDAGMHHSSEAFICSYECTFCPDCSDGMSFICPNCQGELVKRPTRTKGVIEVAGEQLKRKLLGKKPS